MTETAAPPHVRKGRRRWVAGRAARVSLADAAEFGLMTAPPLVIMAPVTIVAPTYALAVPVATPMDLAPFTGIYPLSVSALASARDTRQIRDQEELCLEIHKWVAPLAQHVATKFGMYIPHDVKYSFETLPPPPNTDGSFPLNFAKVEPYDANHYEIKIDLSNCRVGAYLRGMTLHDFVAETIAHELGHIAKKTNPEFIRAVTALRDLDAITQAALAHVSEMRASGLSEESEMLHTLQSRMRLEEVAEVAGTLYEGFGDYVMCEVMTRAASEGRLDDPNWSYDESASPAKYPTGMHFITAMVRTPTLGPPGVTRLLHLTHGRTELLPSRAEVEEDFQGWAERAAAPLMSGDGESLTAHDSALLQAAARLFAELKDRDANGPPRIQQAGPRALGFSPEDAPERATRRLTGGYPSSRVTSSPRAAAWPARRNIRIT